MKTGIIIIGLCMMSAVINHDVVTVKTGENFVINLQKPGRFKQWNVVEPDTGYIQFIKTTSDENPDGYDRFYFKALSEGTRPLRFNLKYTLGTEMNITEKEFRINIESSEKNPTPIITTPDIAKKEDDVMKPIDTSSQDTVTETSSLEIYEPPPKNTQPMTEEAIEVDTLPQDTETYPLEIDEKEPVAIEESMETESQQEKKTKFSIVATEQEKEQFDLAAAIFDRGLFEESIDELKALIKDYPKGMLREVTMMRIGQSYFNIGKRFLDRARESHKKRQKNETISYYEKSLENFDKASEEFKQVINEYPQGDYREKIQYDLGKSYWYGALAKLELDEFSLPFTTDIDTKRFDQSVIEFLRLTIKYKNSPDVDNAFVMIGLYYKTLGDYYVKKNLPSEQIEETYNKALDEFTNIIKNYPESDGAAAAQYWIAAIYDEVLSMRNFEKAVEAYQRFLKMNIQDETLIDKVKTAQEREKTIREKYL